MPSRDGVVDGLVPSSSVSGVKRNIIANYLASAWSALMGLAFIPLYIRYLGIEAYGLIGIFALLQAWFALLDVGLTPALSRETARSLAGTHTPQGIRDLVRSVEWLYGVIALAIALVVSLAAPWLAVVWVRAEHLSSNAVTDALAITGVVIAIRWLSGVYRGVIVGLQRQVWLSGCSALFSTVRGLGVVAVLAWISPTIHAFFLYQGLVAALEAAVLAIQMRRLLPKPLTPPRFRWQALRQVSRFATGMATITILAVVLTQTDKLVLSKLLPLTEFGYYTLASTVAGALYMVVTPLSNVSYPHLTELVARGATAAVAEAYHKFSQALALIVIPVALVLALFAEDVLLLWTRDPALAAKVAPLVALLVIGYMLNGLLHMPYVLQLAYGTTRLAILGNFISVLLMVPALYVGVSIYGAIAAPVVWVVLNAGHVIIGLPIMHRRLLPDEMWRWYGQDVLLPALATSSAAGLLRAVTPPPSLDRPFESAAALAAASILAVVSASLATPLGRMQLRRLLTLYHYFWR